MSQDTILQYVKLHPGVKQSELCVLIPTDKGNVGKQVKKLVKKQEIIRKVTSGNHKSTYMLFPSQEVT